MAKEEGGWQDRRTIRCKGGIGNRGSFATIHRAGKIEEYWRSKSRGMIHGTEADVLTTCDRTGEMEERNRDT